MKGTILVIKANSVNPLGKIIEVQTADVLNELMEAVGGYIEQVPQFNKFTYNGEVRECVAFCNEDGKLNQLPVNTTATHLWHNVTPEFRGRDVLVGNVAVVFGDKEFMSNL